MSDELKAGIIIGVMLSTTIFVTFFLGAEHGKNMCALTHKATAEAQK